MKASFKVSEFSHNDLVHLFSTALYDNYLVYASYDESCDAYQQDADDNDCFEDVIAKILLNGGTIKFLDMESKKRIYGKEGVNWLSTSVEEVVRYSWIGKNTYKVRAYEISLKTLLDGLNTNATDELGRYLHTMFVDEDGDMFTAYNILQIAVFGDVIYG